MARISSKKIDVGKILAEVSDGAAGGIVLFIGTVRNNHQGKKVVGLEYEAYERMAEAKLSEIEDEARRRWPIKRISIVHRKGHLKVGDVSVVVAVSSGHRAEAFEASRFAIESLKRTVPIWKREVTAEGMTEWVEGERIEKLAVSQEATSRGTGSRRRPSRGTSR
ncbi:MAG TPA: molybdenum cofactor biosynthesis protein MoaE [Nitrososphaerales archaeon]|nr:molybdenum cofactor biosynthesis protein MoaE [Nitrososphaerales archaeon]